MLQKQYSRRQPAVDVLNGETDDITLSPLLTRIYAARSVTDIGQLQYRLDQLAPPASLKGLSDALELLHQGLVEQWRIVIVADFDADGATSCALMMQALAAFGFTHVSYLVPDRFRFGYGLTPEIVDVAADQQPDMIITVDNGIASVDGVARASQLGIRTLITDHHLPGDVLPAADAIVNPNQPGDTFPSKHLAGVGVAFYLMMAFRSELRNRDWFQQKNISEPNLAQWLDLVALGTVADVAQLDFNNRILVAQGLARLRAGHACPGIRAMLDVANRSAANLTAGDLGFVIGPRLNAAGRLEDMSIGIQCLLSTNDQEARERAQQLEQLNLQRRELQKDMQQQALEIVDEITSTETGIPFAITLHHEAWHQGIVGLIASKLKERFNRPAIAFASDEQGMLKGSARSIPGLNIRDALDAVATRYPGMLKKFGGHAMAAGLSIELQHLEEFGRRFAQEVERSVNPEQLRDVLWTDGTLRDEELDLQTALELRNAGPWGQGFPEPVFEGQFRIVEQRIVGERHLKLVLVSEGRKEVDAIAFNVTEEGQWTPLSRIEAAYRLDVNEYRGRKSLQLIIEDFRPLTAEDKTHNTEGKPGYAVQTH